jgi:hypothetical protein
MTGDFRLIGSGTGVTDAAGVAFATSDAGGAASRGFFLQVAKARQTESAAANKRIDRFDTIRSRLSQRPDEKVASALFITLQYTYYIQTVRISN